MHHFKVSVSVCLCVCVCVRARAPMHGYLYLFGSTFRGGPVFVPPTLLA